MGKKRKKNFKKLFLTSTDFTFLFDSGWCHGGKISAFPEQSF